MTPEQFRTVGHQLIDWIADYRANVGDFPVVAQVEPGDVKRQLPSSPPEMGESLDTVFADLDNIILPGVSHWNHPSFFAYFPGNGDLSSVIGDMISSGLGVNGLNWEASPALTEVEEVMVDWMRQMVGLSDEWEGVIQDTASTSSLVAMICAREKASGMAQLHGGLQGEKRPLIVYTSAQSHSSIKKAATLAGFGLDCIRVIETDENYAVRPEKVKEAIERDFSDGFRPAAIVATTGTTASTALDPIEELAMIADEYNIWLHVDGAMAGSAMIVPEHRWMWDGIEGADSIVFNPHKWLGAIFDCSLYYVRDVAFLNSVMSSSPSYLKTTADSQVKTYRDWQIPLGRRFRAMKLWCLIREQGVANLQARINRDMANAQWLAEQVDAAARWERVAPVPLQTICVRHVPDGMTDVDEIDAHNRAWAKAINASGKAYLTAAKLDGRWMVRVSIGSLETTLDDVKGLWETMQSAAVNTRT